MEPRIQYVKTNGASIAYAVMGSGPALVLMPQVPISNLQVEWDWPEYRRFYERLGRNRQLVRYDSRGTGLSDRASVDFSLEAQVSDLESVVDHLQLKEFALVAFIRAGPAAITYASRHPERVARLILWGAYARQADYLLSPQVQALAALIDKDWHLFAETASHYMYGHSGGEQARRYAGFIRASLNQEAMRAYASAAADLDVSDRLHEVSSPTLVIHYREFSWLPLDAARELASKIPDARLAIFEGGGEGSFPEGIDQELTAIAQFLGDKDAVTPRSTSGQLVTVLFTDIEDSTGLTQRLGDAKAQELVRVHNAIVRDALREHGGSEIKHTGDGIMASFPSTSAALECAIAIQQAVDARNVMPHGRASVEVHIGLNAGEPIAEESDLFGTAVQLARRICDEANGGEILVSNVVRELAAGKGFVFADLGEKMLRGFDEPVRLFEVRWRS